MYRRYVVKTNICIFPNTLGAGLQIMHPGFRRVDIMVRGGDNCTLLPLVLFGKKGQVKKVQLLWEIIVM